MTIATRKQQIINRLLAVEQEEVLDQIELLLVKADLEATAEASERAIERGEVLSSEEFRKSNSAWLRKKATE